MGLIRILDVERVRPDILPTMPTHRYRVQWAREGNNMQWPQDYEYAFQDYASSKYYTTEEDARAAVSKKLAKNRNLYYVGVKHAKLLRRDTATGHTRIEYLPGYTNRTDQG